MMGGLPVRGTHRTYPLSWLYARVLSSAGVVDATHQRHEAAGRRFTRDRSTRFITRRAFLDAALRRASRFARSLLTHSPCVGAVTAQSVLRYETQRRGCEGLSERYSVLPG